MVHSRSVGVLLTVFTLLLVKDANTRTTVRGPKIFPLNLESRLLPELSTYQENLEHSTVEEVIEDLQVQ